MIRIYFGDKPLIIANKKTDDLKPYSNDPKTKIITTNDKPALESLIQAMQVEDINAGIILSDVDESMENLKNEFSVIQASGGLVNSGNKILLIFRRGKWDLPKGKLDDGENIIDCALREVKEETGVEHLIYQQFLCTSYHTYYENEKHILKESHWHLLRGDDRDKLVPQTDEDIQKCEWVSTDNLEPYLENAPTSIIDVVKNGLKSLKKSSF